MINLRASELRPRGWSFLISRMLGAIRTNYFAKNRGSQGIKSMV